MQFSIQFLKLNSYKIPFIEWLESLDNETQLRIRNRLTRIELGNLGDTKSLGDGIYELRFHFNSGYRVYYGKEGSKIIILINGGNKNTQKRDIEKAKALWEFYLNGGKYE